MLRHFSSPRAGAAAALVVVCGVWTGACARRADAPSSERTLRIGVALPREGPGRSGVTGLAGLLTTESLLATTSDGRQAPRLATDWQWDATRTKLTVQLRPDVFFHDGAPLTGPVAAAALKKSLTDNPAPSFSSVSDVTATGEHEIVIHLSRPDAFLTSDLPGASLVKPQTQDVGTGPFKLVSGEPNIELEAFAKYYRGQPSIDRIQILRLPSLRNAWASLMRGEVDMLHDLSREAIDFVQAETTVHTYFFPRAYYVELVFNVRHPVLQRPDVRRAITEAINKEAAVREGLRSHGSPADSSIWPGHWASISTAHVPTFNPESARGRLDAAGFPVRRAEPGAMPKRLSFTCLLFEEDQRFNRLALVIQKQLFDIGIDMKLEPVSLKTLGPRLARGDFEAFLFEFASGRSLSWTYLAWHSHGNGFFDSGYRAADAVLDRLRYSPSDEETRAATAELLEVFKKDPPAVFIAWQEQARAVSARFDVPQEPGRDIMGSVWQWRVKPAAAVQAQR